jgi:hypothetical protein
MMPFTLRGGGVVGSVIVDPTWAALVSQPATDPEGDFVDAKGWAAVSRACADPHRRNVETRPSNLASTQRN